MNLYRILRDNRYYTKENAECARFLQALVSIFIPRYMRDSPSARNRRFYRIYIGMISAIVFFMPLFGTAMLEMLPIRVYTGVTIAICMVILVICYRVYKALDFQVKNIAFLMLVSIAISIVIMSVLHGNYYVLTSIFYPVSICIFLLIKRRFRFWFGFFLGIFGFYWIILSFRFYDLLLFIPLGIVAVGLIYALICYVLLFFENLAIRILTMFSLFVLAPFGFNWLNVAYLSSYSIFSAYSLLIFCMLIYVMFVNNALRYISLPMLALCLDYNISIATPALHAKVIETHYDQGSKWNSYNVNMIVANNIAQIQKAIKEGYEMIILPETGFPFVMEQDSGLYNHLLDMSKQISIVFGALRYAKEDIKGTYNKGVIELDSIRYNSPKTDTIVENSKTGYYNSIFTLANETTIIADKIALVPFGETLPFDSILNPLYEKIFHTSFGFNKGSEVISLSMDNKILTIANCYEGTTGLPYSTNAQYIIMLSNNAWFYPSLQHIMQKMIIKYYARISNSFVYHATNYTPKAIISPNNWVDF